MNRPYPLLVKPEEEETVRNAARLINDKIKRYKENFSVKDELDLVIMCCLELAADNINQAKRNKSYNDSAENMIDKVSSLLNEAILKSEETTGTI